MEDNKTNNFLKTSYHKKPVPLFVTDKSAEYPFIESKIRHSKRKNSTVEISHKKLLSSDQSFTAKLQLLAIEWGDADSSHLMNKEEFSFDDEKRN